jgi:hypothetical protein
MAAAPIWPAAAWFLSVLVRVWFIMTGVTLVGLVGFVLDVREGRMAGWQPF